jgi:uncharacterized protein involved in high-affinity Fe2+ transport
MTSTAKSGVILVIILAVLVLIWSWKNDSSSPSTVPANQNSSINDNSIIATTTPISKLEEAGMSAKNDYSNESLEKDVSAIDTQLQGLNEDNTAIDPAL